MTASGSSKIRLRVSTYRAALGEAPVPDRPKCERAHRTVADERADEHVIMDAEYEDERAGKRRRCEQADPPNQRHDRHDAAEAGRVTLCLERGDLVRRFPRKSGTGKLID